MTRRPGDRAGLDREHVLLAARALLQADGVDGLTMRRLAGRLGVAPNTIYSHYADKGALLDAVLDAVLGEIDLSELDGLGWRDGLVRLMELSRRMLLARADLLPHLLSRPMVGPNASRLGEETLALLARGGIQDEDAVDALRALLTFTFGSVVLDAVRNRDTDPTGREETSRAAFGRQAHLSRVNRLAGPLSRRPAEESFATSLRWLIDGIARDSGPARGRR